MFMKKITLLLVVMSCTAVALSQGTPFPNFQQQGSPVTRWLQQGAVHAQKGIINGVYPDTATANLGYIDFYPGAQIFTTKDTTFWLRNPTATKWIRPMSSSVDITSITFNTDSSVIICFGDGTCDTIPLINSFLDQFFFDSTCNCWRIDSSKISIDINNFTIVNDSTLIVCFENGACDTIGISVNLTINNIFDSSVVNVEIFQDSLLIICTGANVCDTINLGNTYNNVYFINDSTVVACDTAQVVCVGDTCTTQQLCDTIVVGRQNLYLFQNGLKQLASGIVEFGAVNFRDGPSRLLHDTYLNTEGQQLSIMGATITREPLNIQNIQNTELSSSVASFRQWGPASGSVIDYLNQVKLYVNYTDPVLGDTVGYMDDRIGYYLGTNTRGSRYSIGVDNVLSKQSGIMFHTLDTAYTDAVTIFGTQTPKTIPLFSNPNASTFLPNRIAIFKTDGTVQLPLYPNTRNDGATSIALYPDEDGNLLVGDISGGSSVTIINDTTIMICSGKNIRCDTVVVSGGDIQNVFVINDSTLLVCNSDNSSCDTLSIPQAGFDRGFFDPNQASIAPTLHYGNNQTFAIDRTQSFDVYSGISASLNFGQLHTDSLETYSRALATSGNEIYFMGASTILPGVRLYSKNFGRESDILIYTDSLAFLPHTGLIHIDTMIAGKATDSVMVWSADNKRVGYRDASSIGTTYTFTNGINESSGTVKLGGTLVENTAISGATFNLQFNGAGASYFMVTGDGTPATPFYSKVSEASGNAVKSLAYLWHEGTGGGSNGIGVSLDFLNSTTLSTGQISNQIISKFTTAADATRTSQLLITGVNSGSTGNLVAVDGTGVVGIGNFSSFGATRLDVVDNSVAGGAIANISTTSTAATANTQTGLLINLSGANVNSGQSTYGIRVFNTHTGTTPLNYGLYSSVSGSGRAISANQSGTGRALEAINTSTGIAAYIQSTTGTALDVQSSATTFVGRFLTTTSATNTQQLIASFQHQTSGTPAAGFGSYINFSNETTTTAARETAIYGSRWSDATDATRQGTAYISSYQVSNPIEKLTLFGHYSTLTESAATAFLRIAITSGSACGGEIIVTIEANDATDYQSRTMRFIWAATNDGTTTRVTISTPEEVVNVSTGTLTATIDTNVTGNNVDFRVNAVSSLTQTTLRANCMLIKNFGSSTILPQN